MDESQLLAQIGILVKQYEEANDIILAVTISGSKSALLFEWDGEKFVPDNKVETDAPSQS